MRINSSVNNIQFSANKNKKSEIQKNTVSEHSDVKNISFTPDYQVKTPQKYSKIDTVNLPENLTAHIYKLESGQKVVIVPKQGPTVIKTYVNTGSFNEKDSERGISHFVEHSLFNGSEGLNEGEFFETVNKMGANTNASTGFSATDYYIKSNLLKDTDFEKQVKIHASMIETPKFTPEMIEKEKGPVTSEISMILDDSENIAVNSTLKNLFNIKTTSEDMIGGTIENINNLTREKVMDYFKQNYYPSNMTTVITGDIDEKNAISLVSKYMHSKAEPNNNRKFETMTPIDKTVRCDITSDKTPSAFISIGLKGPENNNVKDLVIFDAVGYVLTDSTLSRINKNLEELQAEAGIDMERLSSKRTDNTALLITAEVDDKKADVALEKINSAIESLKTNPPGDEELAFIKKNLKFDFAKRFEKSANVNSLIGGAMLDGNLDIITNYEKYIDNLTQRDFVDFANKYLDTGKESITVVHPAKTISFGSRKPLNTNNVSTQLMPNNTLLLENSTDKNVVYADFKMTSDLREQKVGTALLLSKLLERGCSEKTKDEFYEQAEKDGIMLGFSAGNGLISASSVFMKPDTEKALKDIKTVLLNPRFTNSDFEEVKKQIVQDIKDTPVNAKEGLYAELFKGQDKGITSKELLNGINNTTLQDVKDFYADLISNSQLRVSVSGPFKDSEFKNTVEKELSTDLPEFINPKLSDKSSYKPVTAAKVVTQTHNKSQAEIMTGYKFKISDNSPEKKVRYSLLNIILGGTASSRLFSDLRETQKLAYHVKSYLDYNDDDTGVCNLYIKTTTDSDKSYRNIEKSISGFDKHVQKLLLEKVTEEELENAKLVFKNRMFNDNETTSDKNASLLSNMHNKYGIELTNDIIDMVDKITIDDIQQAAKEIFENKPVYSVVAKQKALDKNSEFLNKLTQ